MIVLAVRAMTGAWSTWPAATASPSPPSGAGGTRRSDRAPHRPRACKKTARQGGEAVLIDGALIPTQRRTGKADRKNHSGQHHHHGLHFLAPTGERGRLIRMSAARSGRTHGDTATRHDHAHLRTDPTHATQLPGALLVLTNHDVNR